MRNGTRLLLFTLLLAGGVLAVQHAPEAMERLSFFQVEEVRVEGARYLDREEAVQTAALPEGFSVWGELEGVAARLRAHPLVEEVRVRRRLPSTLVLEVREREPVALLPTPALVPVDAEGRTLPIDASAHRLDLPLLRPRVVLHPPGTSAATAALLPASRAPAGEEGLTPVQLRLLATEVARLPHLEPVLWTSVSEVALDPWGDVVVELAHPGTALHFRPPLTSGRLRQGLEVLADAMERYPERVPAAIDLRFPDQVVVRYPTASPR